MNQLFSGRTVAILLILGPASQAPAAEIKCWTNSEGIRECGNVVPPEYTQQGYSEFSDRGMVIDRQEHAKTEAELAEQQHQAKLAAEREHALQQQRRQDAILLKTFSSDQDIIAARDAKLSAMDAQIGLAQNRIEKLREDLDQRQSQAAADERSGRAPPADLLEDITSLKRQIQSNEAFIEEMRTGQDELRAVYDADLARFRELKAAQQ